MTTTKPVSEPSTGPTGVGSVATKKTMPLQKDKPAKPVRPKVPKLFRPRAVVGDATAAVPPVILWDDPFDPTTDPKAKG
jgi:hypothetical protein